MLGRPWRRGCSTCLTARDSLPAGPSCRPRRHCMWEAREQGGGFSGIGGCSALEKRGSGACSPETPRGVSEMLFKTAATGHSLYSSFAPSRAPGCGCQGIRCFV